MHPNESSKPETEKPATESPSFRSGFVSIVGLPNVGKSTLVNQFLQRAACITSFKPQTTRHHVRCVVTSPQRQIILIDTPGWITGQKTFDKFLRKEIYRGLDGVDVILFMVDATRLAIEPNQECWKALATHTQAHKILVLNKIDRFSKVEIIPLLDTLCKAFEPKELVPLSAADRTNLEELDRVITGLLPEGPRYYPDDTLIDRPLEFVFAEFVREQVYLVTRQELPFATAVMVESLEQAEATGLQATILVEKESQKGILIGAKGSMIREIRERATRRISEFVKSRRVRVELTVKVKKNWRQDPAILKTLGYE